jgi:hypothetical protein
VLVWPDGIYSHEQNAPLRTTLSSRTYPQAVTHLRAEIQPHGDLVIEGQDFGPLVESVWGDTDYEYWVTVPGSQLRRLVEGLEEELRVQAVPPPNTDQEQGESDGSEPDVSRRCLILLSRAFREDVFGSDSEFKAWLHRHNIPSQLSSY